MTNVQIKRIGRAGIICLDRPRALNATTHDMIVDIGRGLESFANDPTCEVIIQTSSTPKVFCAGGDLRQIREDVISGQTEKAMQFFRDEYALIERISSVALPFVSLIDGVCMGGGAGLSVHGRYRVFSEQAVFAMPETAIGFFPDIGASHFLPRIGRGKGLWLALTSSRVSGTDAVRLGIGTHLVRHDQFPPLFEKLCHGDGRIDTILNEAVSEPEPEPASIDMDSIERAFRGRTLNELLSNLSASGEEGERWLQAVQQMSPRSVEVTFDLLDRAAGKSLSDCLSMELQLAAQMILEPDFSEGVRAILVDKTKNPKWSSRRTAELEC